MHAKLTSIELQQIEGVRRLIQKYDLEIEELLQLLKLGSKFPMGISKKLTVLESAVKYFLENKTLQPKDVAKILGREKKNILQIYKTASRKYPQKFITKGKVWVPSAVLVGTKLSAQEAVVTFLHEKKNLTFHEIAVLLKRDDRTIWTAYQRGKAKYVL